jgi:biotin carboxyl carrier protein
VSTFDVDVNGRRRIVAVERLPQGWFKVTVDGASTMVDAARVGQLGLSLLFPEDGHRSGTVQLAPTASAGERLAVWEGISVPVTLNGRRHASSDGAGGRVKGEQKVVAPMPGRVVRVLVSEGDVVEARQPVVGIEAMTMETALRSPVAGRIREVAASAGTSVEAGRVLVVIE